MQTQAPYFWELTGLIPGAPPQVPFSRTVSTCMVGYASHFMYSWILQEQKFEPRGMKRAQSSDNSEQQNDRGKGYTAVRG